MPDTTPPPLPDTPPTSCPFQDQCRTVFGLMQATGLDALDIEYDGDGDEGHIVVPPETQSGL